MQEFEELEEAPIPQEAFTGSGEQLFDFMAGGGWEQAPAAVLSWRALEAGASARQP
jgi:hypothetical protein